MFLLLPEPFDLSAFAPLLEVLLHGFCTFFLIFSLSVILFIFILCCILFNLGYIFFFVCFYKFIELIRNIFILQIRIIVCHIYAFWPHIAHLIFGKAHVQVLYPLKVYPYGIHPFQTRSQVHQNIITFSQNIQEYCLSSHFSNFFLWTSVLLPIRTVNSFSAIIVRTVLSDKPVNSHVSFTERRSFSGSSCLFPFLAILSLIFRN